MSRSQKPGRPAQHLDRF